MSTVNFRTEHLITPIPRGDFFGARLRDRDAYDAPPGAAPFDRYLQTKRITRLDTFELSKIHLPTSAPAPSQSPQAMATPLLPSLGEVLDIEPQPKLAGVETRLHQQLIPATGRALDIYA